MVNIDSLKGLVQEIDNGNVCVPKEFKRKTYRVDIINYAQKKRSWGHATATKYLYVGSNVTSKSDPRLVMVAISKLNSKQCVRLGLTKDQLSTLEFVRKKSEYVNHVRYEADSRALTLSPDEYTVQRALGIKDPTPIAIQISLQ